MLFAQDLTWVASDAGCTRLHLIRLRCWLHRTLTWVASDANYTRFYLVRLGCWLHKTLTWFFLGCRLHRPYFGLPRMLIAQDFILVSPRMLIAHDFILFRLECSSHRTSIWFASNADCTGLDLVSPRMLIVQDFILFASNAGSTRLTWLDLHL